MPQVVSQDPEDKKHAFLYQELRAAELLSLPTSAQSAWETHPHRGIGVPLNFHLRGLVGRAVQSVLSCLEGFPSL